MGKKQATALKNKELNFSKKRICFKKKSQQIYNQTYKHNLKSQFDFNHNSTNKMFFFCLKIYFKKMTLI